MDGFGLEGAARGDEGGDVRDGVADAPAGLPGSGVRLGLDMHCLVEVHGTGRVDGDEGDVHEVMALVGEPVGGEFGFPFDVGRKRCGEVEFLGNGAEIQLGGE